jgi:hypothetical protein
MRRVLFALLALASSPLVLGAPAPRDGTSGLPACAAYGAREYHKNDACEATRRVAEALGQPNRSLDAAIAAQLDRLKKARRWRWGAQCDRRKELHAEIRGALRFLTLLEPGPSSRLLVDASLPSIGDFCVDDVAWRSLDDQYDAVLARLNDARSNAEKLSSSVNDACRLVETLCQPSSPGALDVKDLASALREAGPDGEAAARLLERTVGTSTRSDQEIDLEEWLSSGNEATGILLEEVSRSADAQLLRDAALIAVGDAARGLGLRGRAADRSIAATLVENNAFRQSFRAAMRSRLMVACPTSTPGGASIQCLQISNAAVENMISRAEEWLKGDVATSVASAQQAARAVRSEPMAAYRETMTQVSTQLEAAQKKRDELMDAARAAAESVANAERNVRDARSKVEAAAEALARAPDSAREAVRGELDRAEGALRDQSKELQEVLREQSESLRSKLTDAVKAQLGVSDELVSKFNAIPGIAEDVRARVTAFTESWRPEKIADAFGSKLKQQFGDVAGQGAGGIASIGVTLAVAAMAERKAARRHKEVMRALGQINARLVAIEGRLANIERTLEQMQSILKRMDAKLDSIQVTLDVNFARQERFLVTLLRNDALIREQAIEACGFVVTENSIVGESPPCGEALLTLAGHSRFAQCDQAINSYPALLSGVLDGEPPSLQGGTPEARSLDGVRVSLLTESHRRLGACWRSKWPPIDPGALVANGMARYVQCATPERLPTVDSPYDTPLPESVTSLVRFVSAVSAHQDVTLRSAYALGRSPSDAEWRLLSASLDRDLSKSQHFIRSVAETAEWSFGIPQGLAASTLVPVLARWVEKAGDPADIKQSEREAMSHLRSAVAESLSAGSDVFAPGPSDGSATLVAPEAALNIGRILVASAYGVPDAGNAQRYRLDTEWLRCRSCIASKLGSGWTVVSAHNDLSCRSWARLLGASRETFWCARPSPSLELPFPASLDTGKDGDTWRRAACARVAGKHAELDRVNGASQLAVDTRELAMDHMTRLGGCGEAMPSPLRAAFIVPLPVASEFQRGRFAVSPVYVDLAAINARFHLDGVTLEAVKAAVARNGTPQAQLGAELIAEYSAVADGVAACPAPYANERLAELIESAWNPKTPDATDGDVP